MKNLSKIIGTATVFLAAMCVLAFYQSCKPYRTCVVLENPIYGAYINKPAQAYINDSTTIHASDLGLAITFAQHSYHCQKNNFSFFNEAYAYKPNFNYYFLDTIKSVTITSNQAFDNAHPAGTPLNEYFTIPDFNEYNNQLNSSMPYQLQPIYLNQAPADSTLYHQFTVAITMQSSNLASICTFEHIKIIP